MVLFFLFFEKAPEESEMLNKNINILNALMFQIFNVLIIFKYIFLWKNTMPIFNGTIRAPT